MIRTTELPPQTAPRAQIAAALFAGALALLALIESPAPTPAPAIVAAAAGVAVEPAPAGPRSASYYPEHLAALQSLSGFKPIADAGEKPTAPSAALAVAAKPAPFEPKIVRRAEAPAKTVVAALPPVATPLVAPPPPAENQIKIFGLPLPAPADIGNHVASLRDTAGRWGAAAAGLGEKVAALWR